MAPARPASADEQTNTITFVLAMFIPASEAATSLSRTARQVRPDLVFERFNTAKSDNAANGNAT